MMKRRWALAIFLLLMAWTGTGLAAEAALISDVPHVPLAGEEAILLGENEGITLTFSLEEDGAYGLSLHWYCPQGSVDPEIRVLLDGSVWLERLSLNRVWQDTEASFAEDGRFRTDNRGNEITPAQENALQWQRQMLRDLDGYSDAPLLAELKAGEHTLEIICLRESVALGSCAMTQEAGLRSYQRPAGELAQDTLILQAEMAARRSDAVLTPNADRSTPSTQPNATDREMQNIIGGASWRYAGQWIEWEVDVPREGLYLLQFKYRQDGLRGLPAARRLYVDGTVPCAELACLEFPYGQDWQTLIPRTDDGEPISIYLEQGRHTLRLEAILGEMGPTLQVLEDAVYSLNALYRRIIMITGTSPDPYRDYYLEREIPELADTMTATARLLESQVALLEEKSGSSGNQAAILHEVIRQLDSFVEHPATIQKRLDSYKNNISALSELLLTLREQPLELDAIALTGSETPVMQENAGFMERTLFRLRMFLATFSADYNAVGSAYDQQQSLTVWVNTGNIATAGTASGSDQAQVLKQLIDDEFVKNTGINVNVSLVNTADTLTQAILAGEGPDVALFVPKGTPTTLGMRGAVADLSQMEGFEEIQLRFGEASFIGYSWQGEVYALPETMSFNMLFVRTDIFEELGLEIPNTWDEFMDVTAKLQKRNLMVGIPESQQVFEALLMQRGGSVYAENLMSTALASEEAISAFTQWTNLYVQYGLPVSFDFFNRFRTGEMATGIVPLTMYTQLSVAAPELKGLWQMAPIPGTMTEDGLSRLESCSGTGSMIIAGTDMPQQAWAFLDWWTSDEIQYRFGSMLEILIGTSSRYNTANLAAFERLPWSAQELEALSEQRAQVWDTPQTPATYYVTRSLTNAFRSAVYNYENPREVLEKYSHDMDAELTRKYAEFSWEGMP